MSIERIVNSLEQLVTVHYDLLNISTKKTKAITEGSADKLQQILTKEQSYIHKLSQMEENRERIVDQWFVDNGFVERERTITNMLDLLDRSDEKQCLEKTTINLTHAITELKHQEQLNAALIQQSMHFIQTSLSMLKPSIQSLNYDRKQDEGKQKPLHKQSVFDSRA